MLVFQSKGFEKSFKKVLASGKVTLQEIEKVITMFMDDEKLPSKYRDHALQGDWKGYRECHIKGDLLLIYKIEDNQLVLVLIDIGSHSQLFG
jgi:mRNA interferase YafQ